jgi:SPP1 family predicted phage head-tail adaptor
MATFYINPGELRQEITINYNAQPDRTDDSGVSLPDWQPITDETIYAKREPLSVSSLGRYFFQAASTQYESDLVYTIRYRKDIKAGMQIADDLGVFEIMVPPADPKGNRQWLLIHARTVLQNGG